MLPAECVRGGGAGRRTASRERAGRSRGMPRSLGSVYGGAVTRFLGGLNHASSRVIRTPGVALDFNGVAVSRDGRRLLVSDTDPLDVPGPHAVHEFSVDDGSALRVVGGRQAGQRWFRSPHQVWIADDNFVFVADRGGHRVVVLSPDLTRLGDVGKGHLRYPVGVCANADVVVVSEIDADRVSVFSRGDGSLISHFGSYGSGDGQLNSPGGLCFMWSDRHVVVADYDNHRVSVFSVAGEFIRHVGVGVLKSPVGVACSTFDELVVADPDCSCLFLFSGSGDLLMTLGDGRFVGAAIHDGTPVLALQYERERCVIWKNLIVLLPVSSGLSHTGLRWAFCSEGEGRYARSAGRCFCLSW
jgi:DNA-binding beta-propeller fold protein YncE